MSLTDALRDSLSKTFGNLSVPEFVEQYWPDKVFHLQADPERWHALLEQPELKNPGLLFERTRSQVTLSFYDGAGKQAGLDLSGSKAAVAYRAGMTAMFYRIHDDLPFLSSIVDYFAEAAGIPSEFCNAHIFMSRPGNGFALHFDYQDVLTLQIRGRKTWQVGTEAAVPNPHVSQVAGNPIPNDMRPYWPKDVPNDPEYVPPNLKSYPLQPGSVLFVPRGHWHFTKTDPKDDQDALAIAIGFASPPWMNLALEEIRGRLMKHLHWRQPVLGGWGGAQHPTTGKAEARLGELLKNLTADIGDITPRDILGKRKTFKDVASVRMEMERTFDTEAAKNLKSKVQFRIHDSEAETFHVDIEGGKLKMIAAPIAEPDLTIAIRRQDFLAMAVDPSRAYPLFLDGQITIEPFDPALVTSALGAFTMFS